MGTTISPMNTMTTEAAYRYMQLPNSGIKPVLGIRGNKYASCVVNDELTVRVEQFDLREWDSADPVDYHGQPYSPVRAASFLQVVGKRKGITLAAARILARILGEPEPTEPPEVESIEPKQPIESKPSILKAICEELNINPSFARRALRASGMTAPYDNEAQIRNVLNGRKPK